MLTSRANHGCVINVYKNEIYVAGGFTRGEQTKSCEAYSISKNKWRQLPQLNQMKVNSSLCTLNGRMLYCLGGIIDLQYLDTIELLDLNSPKRWESLSTKLPRPYQSIGALPISDCDILLFGGWNNRKFKDTYKLTYSRKNGKSSSIIETLKCTLKLPDLFPNNGTAIQRKDHNEVQFCGRSSVHIWDLSKNTFVYVAN